MEIDSVEVFIDAMNKRLSSIEHAINWRDNNNSGGGSDTASDDGSVNSMNSIERIGTDLISAKMSKLFAVPRCSLSEKEQIFREPHTRCT